MRTQAAAGLTQLLFSRSWRHQARLAAHDRDSRGRCHIPDRWRYRQFNIRIGARHVGGVPGASLIGRRPIRARWRSPFGTSRRADTWTARVLRGGLLNGADRGGIDDHGALLRLEQEGVDIEGSDAAGEARAAQQINMHRRALTPIAIELKKLATFRIGRNFHEWVSEHGAGQHSPTWARITRHCRRLRRPAEPQRGPHQTREVSGPRARCSTSIPG